MAGPIRVRGSVSRSGIVRRASTRASFHTSRGVSWARNDMTALTGRRRSAHFESFKGQAAGSGAVRFRRLPSSPERVYANPTKSSFGRLSAVRKRAKRMTDIVVGSYY